MSAPMLHFRNGLHAATVCHLARRLSEAETSLTTLTGGAVDAILDRTGNPYLLRAAQMRFRQNESRVQALLDSVPDVIIAINHAGKILFHSAAATSVLGYDPEELVGQNMFVFVHSESVRQLNHALFGVIEKFNANDGVDFQFLARDGSWRTFEAAIAPLMDPSESQGLILVLRDPKGRRQAQEDAARDKTARETERFLARLAQELQTPLTPALLGVHALLEDAPSAEVKRTLEMIRHHLERQSRLLEELFHFTSAKSRAARQETALDNLRD